VTLTHWWWWKKGVKMGKNLKESLTELNVTKQRNFLLGDGAIINYVSCKLYLQKILML
jgi:hypothetical protein